MSSFFKGMGQLASLFRNLPNIKEQMEQLQQRLGQITAEGDAGAGMVKVRCNGRMEVVACSIAQELLDGHDREMLEDLIKAAVNQAMTRVRQLIADEYSKMTAGMGITLPPGMNLPPV